jgi:polar amino acid transport system substrate-binding protein
MKRIVSLLLVAVMACCLFAGCAGGAEGWEAIEEKGELIVGLDATFAPMGYTDENGEIVGFDIDLATAAAEILGVKVKFQPIVWDAKEMELSSKRIDCIWNGMSQTPERAENMALTQPYLNNRIIIMGKAADAIATIDDLKGKKIGVQAKSSALDALMASDIYEDVKNDVTEMPTYDEVILDMKAGRLDVMIVDEVLGEFKNALLDEADKMKVAPANFGDDLYVIGCRKGETDVADKLNGAIKALIENGKAAEISEKWFGTNLVLPIE